MNIIIRKAEEEENKILTNISIKSKKYWNYPEEYFDIWKDELSITKEYIKENMVYVAEENSIVVGYFSIIEVTKSFFTGNVYINKGWWLEHIFILPKYIKNGIGTKLIDYSKVLCKRKMVNHLNIFSDPNSKGFYDKIGAEYIKESLSNIEGRTVLLYKLEIY